jgi:hypothetical protein
VNPYRRAQDAIQGAAIELRAALKNVPIEDERRPGILDALAKLDEVETALYDALPPIGESECRCSEPDGGHWSWCPAFARTSTRCDGLCVGPGHRETCPEHVVPL